MVTSIVGQEFLVLRALPRSIEKESSSSLSPGGESVGSDLGM
jgi:hypothetical protein